LTALEILKALRRAYNSGNPFDKLWDVRKEMGFREGLHSEACYALFKSEKALKKSMDDAPTERQIITNAIKTLQNAI